MFFSKHFMRLSAEDFPSLKLLGVNVGVAYHSHGGGTWISRKLGAKMQSAEFWGLLFNGSEDFTPCLCPTTESLP